jgi:hypothetical protein
LSKSGQHDRTPVTTKHEKSLYANPLFAVSYSSFQGRPSYSKPPSGDVYRTLGAGFSEVVYDRAMQVGLRIAHIKYENQKVVELKYKNHSVGEDKIAPGKRCARSIVTDASFAVS